MLHESKNKFGVIPCVVKTALLHGSVNPTMSPRGLTTGSIKTIKILII
ncbi:MAG TPA: hypothetical protein LFV92_04045 [Rickettsia endosymbiont of Ceroptres masudai]|nr:hypothetical protein [Rickettsia endosymbiont of Ceroptres masudai]